MSEVIDRLPPHSAEAEQGVLGCIFLDPELRLGDCIEAFGGIGPDVFYDLRHKEIYSTCLELYEEHEPIDVISVMERLRAWNRLEQVGGLSYLSQLQDVVPSSANLSYYTDLVFEKFILRRMVRVCTEVAGRVYQHEGTMQDLIDQCEADLTRLFEHRTRTGDLNISELVSQSLSRFEQMAQSNGALAGISTGIADLDRKTNGFCGGEMVVIAGRPSTGKTSLLFNIVDHVAVTNQIPVGVIELEMTGQALIDRMILTRARVPKRDVRDNTVTAAGWQRMQQAAIQIRNAPLYIDDQSGQSIMQIRSKARRWARQHGIKMLGIDYLGLANAAGGPRRFDNRLQEVAEISHGCKGIAKELNIPVVVLCQLNRQIEHDKNRKPRMSDLRECGDIEQDADVIGILYKPGKAEEEEEDDPTAPRVPVNLLLAKHRNEEAGVDVNLMFTKGCTKFEGISNTPEPDEPPPGAVEAELPMQEA